MLQYNSSSPQQGVVPSFKSILMPSWPGFEATALSLLGLAGVTWPLTKLSHWLRSGGANLPTLLQATQRTRLLSSRAERRTPFLSILSLEITKEWKGSFSDDIQVKTDVAFYFTSRVEHLAFLPFQVLQDSQVKDFRKLLECYVLRSLTDCVLKNKNAITTKG